jgi:hypothetical protein
LAGVAATGITGAGAAAGLAGVAATGITGEGAPAGLAGMTGAGLAAGAGELAATAAAPAAPAAAASMRLVPDPRRGGAMVAGEVLLVGTALGGGGF